MTYYWYLLHNGSVDRRHEINGCFISLRHHCAAYLKHADIAGRKLVPGSSRRYTTAENYPTRISAGIFGHELDGQRNEGGIYNKYVFEQLFLESTIALLFNLSHCKTAIFVSSLASLVFLQCFYAVGWVTGRASCL